jgi:argininosuccinate synthase
MADKVVLAYSGGLDTSVAIKWIKEKYALDVIALAVDIGQKKDWDGLIQKALKCGAIKAAVHDARELFVHSLVFPALQAGALYEQKYPLATALGRPLIAKLMVDLAIAEGAVAVAHGCTGKGNDQVRFDLAIQILGAALKIIAPAREWKMTREEEIEYARRHGIEIEEESGKSVYSTDENLWGRSVECGPLEDAFAEPPADVFKLTCGIGDTPAEAEYLEIAFEKGVPVSVNGKRLGGVDLVALLAETAGKHGVGRIDHVENRLVGLKSREIYEAPAAAVLHLAHQELESMTLSKEQQRLKSVIVSHYADMIYNGLWFTGLHRDMRAYVISSQEFVTGSVRVMLHRGNCRVVGRKSPHSLYDRQLATYDKGDQFDASAALGFIYVHGLAARTQAGRQLGHDSDASADILIEGPKDKE